MAFIDTHPAGRALDLGCGTGTNCITLARAGWQAVGVDLIHKAIRKAREKAKAAGVAVDFHQDSVTRLRGVSGPFDLILDIGCYHGLAPAERSIYQRNAFTLLSPGGSLLLFGRWQGDAAEKQTGICPADLEQFQNNLQLVSRQDSLGIRGHAAIWLQYVKPAD
jgi:cyclopropane fatty-acyl-phospholipid synthase-like methyltransferase